MKTVNQDAGVKRVLNTNIDRSRYEFSKIMLCFWSSRGKGVTEVLAKVINGQLSEVVRGSEVQGEAKIRV